MLKNACMRMLTAPDSSNALLGLVMLSALLMEGKRNVFLEILIKKFKEEGKLPDQFHKFTLDINLSQYYELVEGRIPKELMEPTKQIVRESLRLMIEATNDV